jgi:hypothetical protein
MHDESSFVTFYVDDYTCQIGGRKHFILAAASFESEDAVLSQWIQQKAKFGLPPYAEVRWNCRNLSIEQTGVGRFLQPAQSRGGRTFTQFRISELAADNGP